MKNDFKLTLENFKKPTPKIWRRVGMALTAVSGFMAGFLFFAENKSIMIAALIVGVIGTFLTTFFAVPLNKQESKK